MRRLIDDLLAAPGLTPKRFAVLAAVSAASTATLVAAAGGANRSSALDLVAAARERPAPVVEVTHHPARVPQPAAADVPASGTSANTAPAAQPVDTSVPIVDQSPAPAAAAPKQQPQPHSTTPTPAPAKPVSKVKHVFVVTAPAADLAAFASQGRLLTGYKPLDAGPLATRIALVSGQKPTAGIEQGCPTYGGDCLFPVETLTLADQFASKGQRWRGYFEGMPNACTHPDLNAADQPDGDYAPAENPFIYFNSLTQLGECQANDLPLDSLTADLATADATPNFVYVAPKPGDEDSDNAFLADWLPKILDSAAYQADGLLVVLTDNGALLVSQFATGGSQGQTPYDAFGVLRSIEDLFGLDYLGAAADKSATSFATAEISAGLP